MSGEATAHVPLRFLPQRLDVLDPELTVAENVARFAPGATNNRIRARLARFLFRAPAPTSRRPRCPAASGSGRPWRR